MHIAQLYYWGGCILCATIFGIAVWLVPNKLLLKVGYVISPNMMSIIHTPIAWIGYFILYKQNISFFWGLMFVVFSAVLDRLDGRLAKIMDVNLGLPDPKTFWKSLFHKGNSEWGKLIDPAMDKVAIIPIYADIAYDYYKAVSKNGLDNGLGKTYIIGACLIGAIIITDLIGTVIRLDYFKNRGWIRSTGATWAGKLKVLAQWIWLIPYPIADQGWMPDYALYVSVFLDVFLYLILIVALISLVSKTVPLKWEWNKSFRHDVE
jgi:phosphatidylglycerophosphate synthase